MKIYFGDTVDVNLLRILKKSHIHTTHDLKRRHLGISVLLSAKRQDHMMTSRKNRYIQRFRKGLWDTLHSSSDPNPNPSVVDH